MGQEIKNTLHSEHTWYYSVHNLLSSDLLSTDTTIKSLRSINLCDILYGFKTWPGTVKGQFRLKVLRTAH